MEEGKNNADVAVRLDETIPRERLKEICDLIKGVGGVTKVQRAKHNAHLLTVEYDPDTEDSESPAPGVFDLGRDPRVARGGRGSHFPPGPDGEGWMSDNSAASVVDFRTAVRAPRSRCKRHHMLLGISN